MEKVENDYFKLPFYVEGDFKLSVHNFTHCKYLACDTETKLYYDNRQVSDEEVYYLYKQKGAKWIKCNIEVKAYAFIISNGESTVIFQCIEDFLIALASFNVKRVFWYNAKFDFAIIDYFILTNGWKKTEERIVNKKTKGKLEKNTYQSLNGDFGQRYQMRLWVEYKNRNYKKVVTSFTMVDVCNIYGGGLAKNLEDFNIVDKQGNKIRKLTMDYDSADFEADCQYMINDAKGLYLLADKIDKTLIELTGLSFFKGDYITAGGLAKKVLLRDLFGKEKTYQNIEKFKLYFPLSVDEDKDFREHDLYLGGKCLVNPYKLGRIQSNIYKYDVNSMYPKQMRDMIYPFGSPTIYTNKIEYKSNCVYILKLKNIYGLLKPNMIAVWQDSLTGEFVENITEFTERYMWLDELEELKHWYKLSYDIIEILEYEGRYPKGAKRYVDRFYDIKCNSNGSIKSGAKLLLNSAYGKIAQRVEREICDYELQADGYVSLVHKGIELDEKQMLSVVVGSRITALARVSLLSYIRKICKNVKQDFIYCDTDSVHALTEYKDTDNKALGKMKNEGTFEKGFYLAPKSYLMYNDLSKNDKKYEVHCKGVNTKVVKNELDGLPFDKAVKIFRPNRMFKCLSGLNVKGGKALIYVDKMIVTEENIEKYLRQYKDIDELEDFEI